MVELYERDRQSGVARSLIRERIEMKALKANYQANINIMKENIKRGMTPAQVIQVVEGWRSQFEKAGLYGEDEKDFLNACLELIEDKTHMSVVFN